MIFLLKIVVVLSGICFENVQSQVVNTSTSDLSIETVNYNEIWYKKSLSDEDNFKRLTGFINSSPTGKKLIEAAIRKANESGHTLYQLLSIGDGSLTDTTLVRRFQSQDPTKVVYETRSKVILNRHLKTLDAILDLSHELTHFTFREPFNPYDYRFGLKDFVANTVEGRGGEVDAYLVECRVLKEIFPSELRSRSSCIRVIDQKTGSLSKEQGIKEFYKIGAHFRNMMSEIKKFSLDQNEFKKVSDEEAIFISSAWGLPYPVAAVKEYQNIMDRVCKNDQNRLTIMQSALDRSPASTGGDSELKYKTMFEDYKNRCQFFLKD
jgi:hypothetical protein